MQARPNQRFYLKLRHVCATGGQATIMQLSYKSTCTQVQASRRQYMLSLIVNIHVWPSRDGAAFRVDRFQLMDRSQELSGEEYRNNMASGAWPLASDGSRDAGGVERNLPVFSDRPTTARIYRGITANDNSRLHAGDVHNHNWYLGSANTESKPDSPQTKLQRLRSALAFPQMGLRSSTVEDAYSDTCQWLFSTPEYRCWQDHTLYPDHHGFFWIKGKPGSGKSTVMKTMLSRTESTNYRLPNEIMLSYFFNARGDVLEKTTEGLYRSLLCQALGRVSTLSPEVAR